LVGAKHKDKDKAANKFHPELVELNEQIQIIRNLPVY
jgi:anthranilate/para-aminobenzoate synthase component II